LIVTHSEHAIDRTASILDIYPLCELQAEAFTSVCSLIYTRVWLLVSVLAYLPGNLVLWMPLEHRCANVPTDTMFPHSTHQDVLSDMNPCPNTVS